MIEYIGMTVAEAERVAEKAGQDIRVTKRDGKYLIGTCDYRTNRINVEVIDDKITGIEGVG